MKQEEKELLLKDLCARLPYKIKCENFNHVYGKNVFEVTDIRCNGYICGVINSKHCYAVFDPLELKPYLFPLTSMTEEQEEEFNNLFYRYHESAFIFNEKISYDRCSIKDIGFYPCYLQDWLNKNHFDYRGLIEKGLAINATELNVY